MIFKCVIISLVVLLGHDLRQPASAQQRRLAACPTDQGIRWHGCFGSRSTPDGRVYVGGFKDNMFHGQGTLTWPDGLKYVGDFSDNEPHGQGTYSKPDGNGSYVGEVRRGVPNGRGTLKEHDGQKYIGGFREGRRHGFGVLYGSNGAVLQAGIWENNQLIHSSYDDRPPASGAPAPTISATPPPAAPKSSSGSAFRIANGLFVTNQHVINGCASLKLNSNSGARVVASDPTRDLALVSIDNDRGEVAIIRTTRILLNETVTAAGFPLDGVFTGIAITNGTISRLAGLRGDTGELQISAPVQPGNSGGPLLDVAGNVIGVVSSQLNALKSALANGDIPQNVNFAINGSALRAFLDAKGVTYKEVIAARELTGVQIAARASAFTVLIECRR